MAKKRNSKTKKSIRSFTVENAKDNKGCETKFYNKDYTGRYLNKDPASAAKKAATQLCRVKKITGNCVLYLDIRETTQQGKNKGKIYKYRLTRKKLKEKGPFGNEYEIKSKSLNISIKSNQTPNCKSGKHKSRGRKVSRTRKNKPYLK